MKLLFIRHAESESNIGNKTDFPDKISLTGKGREQAASLLTKIQSPPDLIIITRYVRTFQTAEFLINKYPSVPIETWPLHEFTFLSPTRCQNTNPMERSPMVNEYWEKCDPSYIHGPGAESFNQFLARVCNNLCRLSYLNHNFIAVFTHSHTIRVIKQIIGQEQSSLSMKYYRDEMLKHSVPNIELLEIQSDELAYIRGSYE